MIKIPGMLMVGAGDRNAGKTEFVCSLIRKFSLEHNITGIKVTAINASDAGCPHGRDGCGECASFKGNFCITEETNSHSDKDTGKMLAAGAARVFWLKVLKTHLKEGITALFEIIGNDGIMICESSSLRSIVEPGLFFMVTNGKPSRGKPSAEEVVGYADKIILFDGSRFDIDMNKIKLVGGRWFLKMDATAIIMAGGKSSRMGVDKSMLPVGGKPLIEYVLEQLNPHFNQILISSNDVSKYASLGVGLGVEIIPDEIAGKGALVGIASSLRASANQTNFVIACDIPEINISSVRRMLRESEGFDAVVPQIGPTRYEPLFAVYKKSALAAIDKAITSGNYRIIEPLKECRVKYIDLSYIDYVDKIKNLNTMDDYLEFTRHGAARRSPIGKKENAAV